MDETQGKSKEFAYCCGASDLIDGPQYNPIRGATPQAEQAEVETNPNYGHSTNRDDYDGEL